MAAEEDYIGQLLKMLVDGDLGIDWATNEDTEEIQLFRALRHSNKPILEAQVGWPSQRPYKIDPLPKRVSLAFADFLFSVSPVVTPKEESDREALTLLLSESRFMPKLRTGADICVSEREVWWRIYTDPRELLHPILEWRSRSDVVPLMAGDKVLAVAFIDEYLGRTEDEEDYRHLEVHQAGRVAHYLFESAGEGIGTRVQLGAHPYTANIQEEWVHDLPMLAGRVKNGEEASSVYSGLQDLYLDLNEAHTIDAENFRLAGKKRAVMPRKYQSQSGDADAGEEIFWVEDDFSELEGDQGPFKILEYQYEGASSIARKEDITNTIVTRSGLARQLVDANSSEGLAQTGTAARVRLLPTIATIEGQAQEWMFTLPHIISLLQQVDALPEGSLGFGRQWKDPTLKPGVKLSSPLPVDEAEEAQRHQTLINAELESIETAIEELRPTWSRERRILEVKRILANRSGYALDDDGQVISIEEVAPGKEGAEETDVQQGEEEEEAPESATQPTPPRQQGEVNEATP